MNQAYVHGYRTAEADGVFCYTFFKAVASLSSACARPALSREAGTPPRGVRRAKARHGG